MTNNKINKLKNIIQLYTNTETMTNNKQQTAVEWLVKELNQKIDFIPITQWESIKGIIREAKEMEKEKIIKAYNEDTWWVQRKNKKFNNGEDYYKDIYGGCE
jgi:hypothetical protein